MPSSPPPPRSNSTFSFLAYKHVNLLSGSGARVAPNLRAPTLRPLRLRLVAKDMYYYYINNNNNNSNSNNAGCARARQEFAK